MESVWQNSFTYVVVVVIHAEHGRTLIADVDFDEDEEEGPECDFAVIHPRACVYVYDSKRQKSRITGKTGELLDNKMRHYL